MLIEQLVHAYGESARLWPEESSSYLKTLQEALSPLFQSLHYEFSDISLLGEALTHRSFPNEFPTWPWRSNERLEFLGDAILDWLVSEQLFQRFSDLNEGELSQWRSVLVQKKALACWGRLWKLDQFVLLGKGERKLLERGEASFCDKVAANGFEALLGAVYLDAGAENTQTLFIHWCQDFYQHSGVEFFSRQRLEGFDPKSRLQEILQKELKILPCYQSTEMGEGIFHIAVKVGDCILADKTGRNKKVLERELAEKVLKEKLYLKLLS
jgi:ribonuclease-3